MTHPERTQSALPLYPYFHLFTPSFVSYSSRILFCFSLFSRFTFYRDSDPFAVVIFISAASVPCGSFSRFAGRRRPGYHANLQKSYFHRIPIIQKPSRHYTGVIHYLIHAAIVPEFADHGPSRTPSGMQAMPHLGPPRPSIEHRPLAHYSCCLGSGSAIIHSPLNLLQRPGFRAAQYCPSAGKAHGVLACFSH